MKREHLDSQGVRSMSVKMPYGNKTTGGKHAIHIKTKHMISEGKDPDEAYAIANAMSRAGRLTKEGHYIRSRRSKRG